MSTASSAEQTARRLAQGQHGLVTRGDLRTAGLNRHEVRVVTHAPDRWERLTDEVLRLVGSPRNQAQKVLAAVLDAGPGAFLSHVPASRWWGNVGCALEPLHVVRTSPTTRRTELAHVHRVRALPDRWTTALDAVPIVRPELLALQLFATCRFERAEVLVDRLWSRRLLSGQSLERFVGEYCRRGRDGTAALRDYLAPRGPSYVPPDSGLESRFETIMLAAGLVFRRQVDSGSEEHWTGRVDFRHPTLPLVIEVQSELYHSSLVDRRSDCLRIGDLRSHGYVVVEITDTMVWTRPQVAVRKIRAGIADATALSQSHRRNVT